MLNQLAVCVVAYFLFPALVTFVTADHFPVKMLTF